MNQSPNPQYSELSLEITKLLPKNVKKEQGIYITPHVIIDKLIKSTLQYASEHNLTINTALEPSCGTCEMINYLDNSMTTPVTIDGVEFNSTIFDRIKHITFKNKVQLIQADFTRHITDTRYDLIIGNPPYLVCKKDNIPKEYEKYIVGRPNLFGVFILHSLHLLKPNGIMSFIIPKSFLNSSYYVKIRNYIKSCCKIVEIIDFEADNKFIDTDQATFGLILHKTTPDIECKYSMKIGDNYVFTPDAAQLREMFANSTTLEKLGLSVRTGQIVWNEHKEILTNDKTKTILLYNSNLTKDNEIKLMEFKNEEKHQYINLEDTNYEGTTQPVIIVNRGNGNSAYKLNYAFIDDTTAEYVVENHLNVIYSKTIRLKPELMALFQQVLNSFKNERTQQFIKTFLGNNGLSKTELETIFPIYI